MNRQCAFTLIELMVTLAIVALLATIVLPIADISVQRQREQDLRLALRDIRTAIDAYKRAVDEGRIVRSPSASGYPPNLNVLVLGVRDARDPQGRKLYFLRHLPRDPFSLDSSTDPEATWGKRAYASEPNAPHAGDDVFDVYSLSEATGLSGVPYRSW